MNIINRVLCGVIAPAVIVSAALLAVSPVDASGHILVVDGVSYDSTHEAGPVIQWETPDTNPQYASFAERNQMWEPGDNGSDHLPCPYGIHWVSNANVLTISNCLDNPHPTTIPPTTEAPTSTTTTVPGSTSTAVSTTPTTPSSTSTVAPAPTTTVAESTSTSSPETSTAPSSSSSTPSSTTSPSTTSSVASTTPMTSPASSTVAPTTIAPKIPVTGSDHVVGLALAATVLVMLGGALIASRRRA